jgi:hypothetical protein
MVHTLKGFKNCHNFKDKLLDMILTGADNAQLSIPGKVTTRRVVTMPLLRLIDTVLLGVHGQKDPNEWYGPLC